MSNINRYLDNVAQHKRIQLSRSVLTNPLGFILVWNIFVFHTQKFSLLHLASDKKVLAPTLNTENSPDDSFDYVPPKVSFQRILFQLLFLEFCVQNVYCLFFLSSQPKGKRFTTAKAPQSTAINIEELMSPSENESDEEEDEWRPEKPEKGRRVSKKAKATGVSWSALRSCAGRTKRQQLFSTFLVDLMRHVLRPSRW